MSNETKTAAVQPAAPAKEKKPSVVDTFLKGCARGFKVGIENITPAMILGYVLVYILQETGLRAMVLCFRQSQIRVEIAIHFGIGQFHIINPPNRF